MIQIIIFLVGLGSIGLGCKGFTESGIPFSSRGNLTGTPAAFVGMMCILLGVTLVLLPILLVFFGNQLRV